MKDVTLLYKVQSKSIIKNNSKIPKIFDGCEISRFLEYFFGSATLQRTFHIFDHPFTLFHAY